ncbi:MAG: hypothetical protein JKY31_12040 [Rhodobacteraceae bacterium]|nr:hypothetical protein [Paracoccaceae bacterium]
MNIEKSKAACSGPKVFQIGFDLCATVFLRRTFVRNGYRGRTWMEGKLAEDIFYAKYAGEQPLTEWSNVTFFGTMESTHMPSRPVLEAFKEFEFLHQSFPDALFVYDTRDIDDWLRARFRHNGGMHRKIWATRLDVSDDELAEIWRKDWWTHQSNVFDYFGSDERFIHFDCDTPDFDQLSDFLAPWFSINKLPRHAVPRKMQKQLKTAPKSRKIDVENRRDLAFEERVARHCIGKIAFDNPTTKKPAYSPIFARWDGAQQVLDKFNKKLPVVWGTDGFFHTKPGTQNLFRVAQTLTEIKSIGRQSELCLDMQDARFYGIDGISDIANPIIVYNRQPKTTNMVLWPLPGYHTLGSTEYAQTTPIDTLDFDQKLDTAGWRGRINGTTIKELAPNLEKYRLSTLILEDFSDAKTAVEIEGYHQELMGLTRFNLVSRSLFSENIDAALTFDPRLNNFEDHPLFKLLCAKAVLPQWFFKYKYILSISGYDTGSNFFLAANSNSVVLKEEDGWELFYTAEFKPWEHYIPLSKGALDVEEKLDWAKQNPVKCMAMSAASRRVCAKFANEASRTNILRTVFDALSPEG